MQGAELRIAAILAGGASRRMGGGDKARLLIAGERMIDRILARLRPQADLIVVSGREDYGAGLAVVPDEDGRHLGPVAGVFALARWVRAREPSARGFFTAPVDGPFLPPDLIARLASGGGPAIAGDEDGAHPTFAFWTLDALDGAAQSAHMERSISLRRLAGECGARLVTWPGDGAFFNVNSREDLAAAARRASLA